MPDENTTGSASENDPSAETGAGVHAESMSTTYAAASEPAGMYVPARMRSSSASARTLRPSYGTVRTPLETLERPGRISSVAMSTRSIAAAWVTSASTRAHISRGSSSTPICAVMSPVSRSRPVESRDTLPPVTGSTVPQDAHVAGSTSVTRQRAV